MGCCGEIIHGAVGLAKAGAQKVGIKIDAAPPEVIAERRDHCRECPVATKDAARLDRPTKGLTTLSKCQECNCFIGAKTMIASEACPLDPPKWGACVGQPAGE